MDKNKLIQAATKFVQKGQFDRAIKEYQKIVDGDPKDTRILQKIGELHQKRGDNGQAAQTLIKVAETYAADGFFLKATAVYKQVLKLNPGLLATNLKLAELYQQLGLLSDALQQYQVLAAAYEQNGDATGAIETLKKIVELDPDNIAGRIRYAETCARDSRNDDAVAEFKRVATLLKERNRGEEYVKVAERIAYLDPNDVPLCRELASVYLAKGDVKRALAKLQGCFKIDPHDVATLTLLARAFESLGQTAKTITVYKELAKVHAAADRVDDEEAVWKKILALDPSDSDARGRGLKEPERVRADFGAVAAPPARADAEPASRAPGGASETVQRLLIEMGVYLKYGLHSKAAEHLDKILAIAPDDLAAHEKGRELYVAMGNKPRAADELVALVRLSLAAGDPDEARRYLDGLQSLLPTDSRLAELREATGQPVDVVDASDDAVLVESSDEVLVPEGDEIAEEISAFDFLFDQGSGPGGLAPPVDEEDGKSLLAGHGDEPLGGDELDPPLTTELYDAADLAADEPLNRTGRGPPPEPADSTSESFEEPEKTTPPTPARAVVHATAETGEEPEDLAEIEFLLDQGLWDEAAEVLGGLRARASSQPSLRSRVEALDRRLAQGRAGATAAGEPEAGGEPAASAADDFQYPVAEVLAEFKKGVQRTVQPEDVETHYDLGIAYREMGLLDEAVAEFELAARGAAGPRRADCLAMIGKCHAARSRPARAAEVFEKALRVAGLRKETTADLLFELGAAREGLGDAAGALAAYEKVAGLDPGYRNVRSCLNRLRSART